MQIVTSWEERGEERGIQKGFEKGLEKGREEGAAQGAAQAVLRLVHKRFGVTPAELPARLEALSSPVLQDLVEAVLDFQSPADLSAWLDARG